MRRCLGAALIVFLGSAGQALAQVPIPLTITGNQAHGDILLPGGLTGELTITFETVSGLTPTALRASARVVNPVELIFRLPALVSVPAEFLVMIRIVPGPGTDIPDVWYANNPSVVNVAGILRSGADSVKFSLQRKAGS